MCELASGGADREEGGEWDVLLLWGFRGRDILVCRGGLRDGDREEDREEDGV